MSLPLQEETERVRERKTEGKIRCIKDGKEGNVEMRRGQSFWQENLKDSRFVSECKA